MDSCFPRLGGRRRRSRRWTSLTSRPLKLPRACAEGLLVLALRGCSTESRTGRGERRTPARHRRFQPTPRRKRAMAALGSGGEPGGVPERRLPPEPRPAAPCIRLSSITYQRVYRPDIGRVIALAILAAPSDLSGIRARRHAATGQAYTAAIAAAGRSGPSRIRDLAISPPPFYINLPTRHVCQRVPTRQARAFL